MRSRHPGPKRRAIPITERERMLLLERGSFDHEVAIRLLLAAVHDDACVVRLTDGEMAELGDEVGRICARECDLQILNELQIFGHRLQKIRREDPARPRLELEPPRPPAARPAGPVRIRRIVLSLTPDERCFVVRHTDVLDDLPPRQRQLFTTELERPIRMTYTRVRDLVDRIEEAALDSARTSDEVSDALLVLSQKVEQVIAAQWPFCGGTGGQVLGWDGRPLCSVRVDPDQRVPLTLRPHERALLGGIPSIPSNLRHRLEVQTAASDGSPYLAFTIAELGQLLDVAGTRHCRCTDRAEKRVWERLANHLEEVFCAYDDGAEPPPL